MDIMKPKVLILLFFGILSLSTVEGQKYFSIGTEYMHENQFEQAEPYFSTAIKNKETLQAYYNRAVCRIMLENWEGACEDLSVINEYYKSDEESTRLYNLYCCSNVDTVFLTKDFGIAQSNKFKFYQITKIRSYENDTIGSIRRKRGTYDDNTLAIDPFGAFIIKYNNSNIFAEFYISNSTRIYTYIQDQRPMPLEETGLEIFEAQLNKIIMKYYPKHTLASGIEVIQFSIIISPSGEVFKLLQLNQIPPNPITSIREEVVEEISKLIQNNLKFHPLKINDKGVYYEKEFAFKIQK